MLLCVCASCLPVQVCDAVQVYPGRAEQLLQVLEDFSAARPPGAPEGLYDRLRCVLRPWPQLLRDFAAFLNRAQARRCGLVSDITLTRDDVTQVRTEHTLYLLLWFLSVSCWSSRCLNTVGGFYGDWGGAWEKAPPSTSRWCQCCREAPPPHLSTWSR